MRRLQRDRPAPDHSVTTTKKVGGVALGAVALVVAFTFTLGGHSSYSASKHRLSMAPGSTDQINCNGTALNFQQLSPTIGRVQCIGDPGTTTTTTTVPPTTTTTTPTTDPCALTAEAVSCWRSSTGAQAAPTTTLSGTVDLYADHASVNGVTIPGSDGSLTAVRVNGCVNVHDGSVRLTDVTVTPIGGLCGTGGNGQAGPAAVSLGNGDLPNGQPVFTRFTLVGGNNFQEGIGAADYTCVSCNIAGFRIGAWAGNDVHLVDSYIEGWNTPASPDHVEAVNADGSDLVTIDHSYLVVYQTHHVTAALQLGGAAYGRTSRFTMTRSYLQGGNGFNISADCTRNGGEPAWPTATSITGTVFSRINKVDYAYPLGAGVAGFNTDSSNVWTGNTRSPGGETVAYPDGC